MVFITNNADETSALGTKLADMITSGALTGKFIAMRGEMGVGKTVFTTGFASYFGIVGVKSPTYTVVNQYGRDTKIYHFDMYRIGDEDDLYSVGYDDYLDSDGYMIVEWSENIPYAIPSDAIFVTIERVDGDDEKRRITIELKPERTDSQNDSSCI